MRKVSLPELALKLTEAMKRIKNPSPVTVPSNKKTTFIEGDEVFIFGISPAIVLEKGQDFSLVKCLGEGGVSPNSQIWVRNRDIKLEKQRPSIIIVPSAPLQRI